jgi:hypothetical protein
MFYLTMLSDQILFRVLRRLVKDDLEMILKENLVVSLEIMSRLPRDAKEYHTEPSAFVRPKPEPPASK